MRDPIEHVAPAFPSVQSTIMLSQLSAAQIDLLRIGKAMPAPGDWHAVTSLTEAQLRYMGPQFASIPGVTDRSGRSLQERGIQDRPLTTAELAKLNEARNSAKLSGDELKQLHALLGRFIQENGAAPVRPDELM